MCGLLVKSKWNGLFLLFCLPLICLGCGDFDTGGSDKSGSILMIESIDPIYLDEPTRQVDVFRNPLCSNDPENPDPEPYSDHFADVTLSNRPLNNSTEQTASTIYVLAYEVRYQPYAQGSPSLPTINVSPIGQYVGIATHDELLVWHALRMIDELGLKRDEYEFQMLLGVDEQLRRIIVGAGHRLRVYVPFGSHWYAYSIRRLKENPTIAGHVLRNLLDRRR